MRRCLFYFTTQRTGLLPLLYKGPGGFSRPEYRVAMLSSLPGASPAFSSASPDGIDAREKLHDQPAGQNGMMARLQDEGGLPPTGDENAASAHFGRWLALFPLYSNGIFFFAPGAAKRHAQAYARIPVWPRPWPAAVHRRENRRRTCVSARAWPLPAAGRRRRNRRRARSSVQARPLPAAAHRSRNRRRARVSAQARPLPAAVHRRRNRRVPVCQHRHGLCPRRGTGTETGGAPVRLRRHGCRKPHAFCQGRLFSGGEGRRKRKSPRGYGLAGFALCITGRAGAARPLRTAVTAR